MSQHANNIGKSTKHKMNFEEGRKRRMHNDLYGSDEDILELEERKRNIGKRSKKIEYTFQKTLASQRNEKLMLKRNKENTTNKDFLSQEQLEFIDQVIDNNKKLDEQKKINGEIFNNESQNSKENEDYNTNNYKNDNIKLPNNNYSNNVLTISNPIAFDYCSFDNSNKDKYFIEFLKFFTDCTFEKVNEDDKSYEYEVMMIKENKEAKFRLNFSKDENTKFVEYIPINMEFDFPEDDFVYEDVEIFKEDLPKFLRKLLNYKYKQ
jgi:hypothetical protein